MDGTGKITLGKLSLTDALGIDGGYMIRFCDEKVYWIEYCEILDQYSLNREALLDYFSKGHEEYVVCVRDSDTREFVGIITYQSLNVFFTVHEAVRREYLILNEDIWKCARVFYRKYPCDGTEYLIPVLDQNFQLYCFAYEDMDANREIRMLRELTELPDALQFTDVYAEYKYVKIYEFNELAYFFAQYLKRMNVSVEVSGAMWQYFFIGHECDAPDYEYFTVWAEGIDGRRHSWRENLLRSVSVEFECIDRIYEANIRCGNIQDGEGDFLWLIERIRNEKAIIVVGTGINSLNVYDLLQEYGIDILCFMSEDQRDWKRKLFGKEIFSKERIVSSIQKPIFLECSFENSCWGFGEVDRYDYEGYKRNKQYFFIKDYTEIRVGVLHNILKGKEVILVGNYNLCSNVKHALVKAECEKVTYWDLLAEKEIGDNLAVQGRTANNIVALIVEPQYLCDNGYSDMVKEKKRLYYKSLEELGIYDISQYFSESEVLVSIQQTKMKKYSIPCLTPRAILLNISGHMSGNEFFGNLLDGHPDVLQMDWGIESIRSNMFLVCIQLAEESGSNILQAFWKIYDAITTQETKVFSCRKGIFNKKFEELLTYKDSFTSQELFVLIHIAYAEAWGQKISCLQDVLIYYEQRMEIGKRRPIYKKWLSDEKVMGFTINITRNAYTRVGSLFNLLRQSRNFFFPKIGTLWNHMEYSIEHRRSSGKWKRLEVKFESIKLLPQATLSAICDEMGIAWDDRLLVTTFHGTTAEYRSGKESITNFDLKPVYNLYEEYFSDFDRFRINMIFAKEQNRYGYSYVSCRNFSRRQLQEMFLMEYRFENMLDYENNYCKNHFRQSFIDKVNEHLQRSRMEEILQENGENFSSNG